jgi:menaquinone-dependent protoporphyrinogen oxidase
MFHATPPRRFQDTTDEGPGAAILVTGCGSRDHTRPRRIGRSWSGEVTMSNQGTLLIVYAGRHGQTEKIAHRIGEVARAEGIYTDVIGLRRVPKGFSLADYDGVIVASPVYFGKHLKSAEKFVARKLAALSATRSALVSVSLTAAKNREEAEDYVHAFVRATGWLPATFAIVAGAESYTQYGWFTRWIMKRIAVKEGRAPDVTKDTEYTDWAALDSFTREFVASLRLGAHQRDRDLAVLK